MRIKKGKRVKTDFPKDTYKLVISFKHNEGTITSDHYTFRHEDPDEMYDLEMILPWLHAVAEAEELNCADMGSLSAVAGIDIQNVQQYDAFVEYWQTEMLDDTYTTPAELRGFDLHYYDLNGNKFECRYE